MNKPNLFTSTWLGIVSMDRAALRDTRQRVNQHLQHDPKHPEAILAFTLLELLHGHADKANDIVAPLVEECPNNPFYQMAATEIVFQKQRLADDVAISMLQKIEHMVTGWDEIAVLSKLGCMATLRGFWSYGIPLFVRALRAHEEAKAGSQEHLILLWKRNELSLNRLFDSLPSMNRKGAALYDFDSIPIEIVSRAFCVLFTADFTGIREAWPPCVLLASHHHEINSAWKTQQVSNFLIKHCSDWMMYQPTGSPVKTTPFQRN